MNVILLRYLLLVALIISVVGLVLVQCSFSSMLALGTFIMFLSVTCLINICKNNEKKNLIY